ncbi:hypothetical protein H8K90_09800 [Winogradskyella echinorum]|uniref:Uncharacterized protein n=1 Tax=Winogradskyella echinorum TaxID=538189 RepID=A0ABR6Y1P6_9FLAO|nr:hypothetical protein [Winogradskyella echinorum]MBC3846672.1 hypothetical protein [Winogradskyella echinorum]MBC5751020.1 hypothetical protein [Winogradskyella echinorum]
MAVTPIIIAFISGLIVIFLSKKEHSKTKTIQYIFLLVIISLSLTIYKGVTKTDDEVAIESTEQRSTKKLEDSTPETEKLESNNTP